jgi:hypothetical protein
VKIDIRDNIPQVRQALAGRQGNVRVALADTLSHLANKVRKAEQMAMQRVFDRPTAYSLNSLYSRPATVRSLESRVWFKDAYGTRPHYLEPQVRGGFRPVKRFEYRLMKHGYMQANERAVPAAGARLDAFGNMSRGQIVQILSQLRTTVLAGSTSDASNSRRSRAKRAKEAYFVSRGPGTWVGGGAWKNGVKSQHLPRGVWVRRNFGAWGTAVKPVLLFVERAAYRARFDFFGIARDEVRRNFQSLFRQKLELLQQRGYPSTMLTRQGRLL